VDNRSVHPEFCKETAISRDKSRFISSAHETRRPIALRLGLHNRSVVLVRGGRSPDRVAVTKRFRKTCRSRVSSNLGRRCSTWAVPRDNYSLTCDMIRAHAARTGTDLEAASTIKISSTTNFFSALPNCRVLRRNFLGRCSDANIEPQLEIIIDFTIADKYFRSWR